MKSLYPFIKSIAALACVLIPSAGTAAETLTYDNNNNLERQASNGPSARNINFDFLGGNDRLILLRNDDLAGLASGVASMGSGRDVVFTSFNMSGTFNLGSGNDLFVCGGNESFNATDILVLAGTGNDTILVATDLCDYRGEQGNDVFISDGGRNAFNGGEGNDTYSAEAAGEAAQIDLLEGESFVRFTTPESLISIENARGSDFGDTIFGDSNANRIDGLGGDDSIDGDPGNDTISGGSGTNTLFGNTGVDTLVIVGTITSKTRLSSTEIRVVGTTGGVAFNDRASGFEQVIENGVLKSITFFLGETATNNVQQTVIAESSVVAKVNDLVAGQTLNGNGSTNTISGEAGSDDIAGLGGNDTLNGLAGDDCLFGGTGGDKLNGGTGDDTLDGGPGLDNLTGGPGKDTFVFSSALANSADVITDYTVADDTILIVKSLVGNLPAGNLAANRFKNTALGNISSEDRIIYESSTGKLFFDSNGSGAGGRVLIATLPAGRAMVAGEIKIQ